MSDTKNELETLLEKAATEPAHRPAFFSALLEATVWVPGRAADGEQIVEDSALDLQHWEKRRRYLGDPILYLAGGAAAGGGG
ncbi:Protein SseB [Klebsiella pneumoniae IS46]|nr:Protein SseB [Klebsiella pneumoniae IS46]